MVDTQPRSRLQQQVFLYDDYIDAPELLDIDLSLEDVLPVLMPMGDEFSIFVTVQIKTPTAQLGYVEALMPWRHWCRVIAFELAKAQSMVIDGLEPPGDVDGNTKSRFDEMMGVDPAEATLAHQALVMAARQTRPTDPMMHAVIATQVVLLRAAGSTFQESVPHVHPAQPGGG